MEGSSVTVFVTVQKIYYPLLCIMGIPGLYLVRLIQHMIRHDLILSGINQEGFNSLHTMTRGLHQGIHVNNCLLMNDYSEPAVSLLVPDFGIHIVAQTHIQIILISVLQI